VRFREASVDIATRPLFGERGSILGRTINLLDLPAYRLILGPSQTIKYIPRALSLGINEPGRKADHLNILARRTVLKLYIHSPIYIFVYTHI
jgi:hypothetical protein